jgi:hypothetical protein
MEDIKPQENIVSKNEEIKNTSEVVPITEESITAEVTATNNEIQKQSANIANTTEKVNEIRHSLGAEGEETNIPSIEFNKQKISKLESKKVELENKLRGLSPENKSKIKNGVDFVFEQNPELSKIGTPEQYSEYLDSIFQNSKIKDILFHGSKEKIDTLKPRERKFGDIGLFATKNINLAKSYGGITNSLLVNIENPKIITNTATPNTEVIPTEFDGYINTLADEIVVFKSEQTYLLGSDKDKEGFKQFIYKTDNKFDSK